MQLRLPARPPAFSATAPQLLKTTEFGVATQETARFNSAHDIAVFAEYHQEISLT